MSEADAKLWADKAVTRFCQMVDSLQAADYEIQIYGFRYVNGAGWCGEKLNEIIPTTNANGVYQRAALDVDAGEGSFMLEVGALTAPWK